MSRGRDRLAMARLTVGAPRLRARDCVREATLSVIRHPARSLMTAIGTVLGAAAFVATLGLSSTVAAQVSSSFDLRRSTEVVVTNASKGQPYDWQDDTSLARLRALNGVVAAGRRSSIGERPISRSINAPGRQVKVAGADPGALAAIGPRITVGRRYDRFHEDRTAPVVLLPSSIAATLSIDRIGVAVFIDDRAYTVMGIFDDVDRRPESLLAVLMPASTADAIADRTKSTEERDVLVSTVPGAAGLIGSQAALALRPQGPEQLQTVAPADPRLLRREIEANIARSTILLSLVALAVGGLSIANAATSSISSRVPEIGLRRAIGARPGHIFVQLLGETTALGVIGGAVGVMVGLAVIAIVSLANGWSPVLDLSASLLAVGLAAAAGLVAGAWPARRAMRIQPMAALTR